MNAKQRAARPDVFLTVSEYNAIPLTLDAIALASERVRALQACADSTAFTAADKVADRLMQAHRELKALHRRATVSA